MIGIGAAIAFCSAVANALALTLQATEARQTAPEEGGGLGLLLELAHRPRWVFGTVLVIIAWPLQILALSFASLTVVQPILSSFQLVLLILARVWLKERIGWREYSGAAAIAAGVSLLIVAAPQRSDLSPSATRLGPPLAVLALAILATALLIRWTRRRGEHRRFIGFEFTIGAGLGYAWTDLVDKLVSNNLGSHHLLVAAGWLISVMATGALALTFEQSALQQRPAASVGPLVGALQEPLPIVLALWGGLEAWQGGAGRATALGAGIVLVGIGATVIARSPVLAGVAAGTLPETAPRQPEQAPPSRSG